MSDFEDVKPYTQAELDQQAIWVNEFDQWWENEGQYQRAGGGQYERSFAWWAWLNREQNQQTIIDNLKAQLNNMEACYIEKKKECEELRGRIKDQIDVLKAASKSHAYNYREQNIMLSQADDLEKALRGAND